METTTRERKRHRRGNGEGSVFERSDGRWAATISVGRSENGRLKRRTVYAKTKREVLDKLAQLSHQKTSGTLPEPNAATVAEYLRDWLKNTAKPLIRASTHANYTNSLERHVIPVIGGVRLVKLTPAHVQGLYAALQERGLKPKTIRTSHMILRKALGLAVKWRFIMRDPSQDVKPPAFEHKEMQVLDAQQCREFLKAAEGDRLHALYLLAVTTGMRISELCGLQWQDVDFDGKRVSVVRTATYVACKLTVDAPKTKGSRRTIDVSGTVVDALNERRRLAMAEGLAGCPWVFPSREGLPMWRANLHRHSFKPLLKAAGLPDIRFHDLRHTAASLMLTQGINPKVVAERLGHSSIAITLDVYSHVLPSMQQDAASRLDTLLTANCCQTAVKTG